MAISPEFRIGQYGDDAYREDAPHFNLEYHILDSSLSITVIEITLKTFLKI